MTPVRKVDAFWQQLCAALGSSQPPALLPLWLGLSCAGFSCPRDSTGRGIWGQQIANKAQGWKFPGILEY